MLITGEGQHFRPDRMNSTRQTPSIKTTTTCISILGRFLLDPIEVVLLEILGHAKVR